MGVLAQLPMLARVSLLGSDICVHAFLLKVYNKGELVILAGAEVSEVEGDASCKLATVRNMDSDPPIMTLHKLLVELRRNIPELDFPLQGNFSAVTLPALSWHFVVVVIGESIQFSNWSELGLSCSYFSPV